MQNRYRSTSGGMGNRNSPYRGGANDTCMGQYGTRREAGSQRTLWKRIGLMYPGGVSIGGSTNRTLRTSLICQARGGGGPQRIWGTRQDWRRNAGLDMPTPPNNDRLAEWLRLREDGVASTPEALDSGKPLLGGRAVKYPSAPAEVAVSMICLPSGSKA